MVFWHRDPASLGHLSLHGESLLQDSLFHSAGDSSVVAGPSVVALSREHASLLNDFHCYHYVIIWK